MFSFKVLCKSLNVTADYSEVCRRGVNLLLPEESSGQHRSITPGV